MTRWGKYSLITAAVVLGLMLLSMLIVPRQIISRGTAWFAENTHRTLRIEKVFFNPFTLTVEIEGLRLTEQSSSLPFISVKRLMLSGSFSSLFHLAVILDRLELDEPFVNLELLGKQEFNFSDLTRLGGDMPATKPEKPGSSLHFSFNNIMLNGGKIDFTDQTSAKKSQHQIRELSLSIPFISNIPYLTDEYVNPQLRMLLNGSEIRADGQLKPFQDSLETSLSLLLDDIDLAFYAFHSPVPLPVEIKSGVLDAQIDLAYRVSSTAQSKLLLGGDLALTDVDIRELDGRELFSLPTLILDLDRVDLIQQDFNLLSLDLYEPQLYLNRDPQGRWNFERIQAQLRGEPTLVETEERQPASLPRLKIAHLQLQDGKIHYRDDFVSDAVQVSTASGAAKIPQLEVGKLNFEIADLTYPESTPSPFSFKAAIGGKEDIDISGSFAHSPLRLQAQTRIAALPLAEFNDFLPQNLNLKEGKLAAKLAITLAETPEELRGSFSGRAGISSFNLRAPLSDGELLGWENLGLEGIKGGIGPFALKVKEVALSRYLANILIDRKGKINLIGLTAAEPEPAVESEKPRATAEPEVAASETAPPPDIRIDALTLQGGTVSFTDRHLPNTFTTTMYELGGRITGMASAEEMLADVDLRGQLENHSPLSISGKLNPLSKDLFSDLTIHFEDIDLAPLTPYSGTYLGYVIDKGKLYLDLNYHIEHQQIVAQNKILIDQFTFGEPVKSAQATSLPIGLAIALLKDQNGEIHLDVPISGNLNDPSFSIAGTIFTVLKNLLVKAASSPFSLLASILGGGSEDFSQISFLPGRASLTAGDQNLLGKLAKMLSERPALKLEISAFIDPENDPEGYRQIELKRLIAAEWQRQVEPQEGQEMTPEEYLENLWQVYKQAKFPKPRNVLGMQKKLPANELEKLLLANMRVGDEELHRLAKARAAVVQEELIRQNPAIKPRMFLKNVEIATPPEKDKAAARVEFGIGAN